MFRNGQRLLYPPCHKEDSNRCRTISLDCNSIVISRDAQFRGGLSSFLLGWLTAPRSSIASLFSLLFFLLLFLLLLFDIVTDREFRKNRSRRCVWSVVADGTRVPRHVPCRYFRLMMENGKRERERERERIHSLGMLRSMLEETISLLLFFFFWEEFL